jgi:aldehyde dehydrogenase (NAD+)
MVTARTMAGSGAHDAPLPYQGFGAMPLAGEWRPGTSGKIAADTDPWSGNTLAEIPLASPEDLDDAMAAARRAQRDWASAPPARRAEVMLAAAEVVRARWAEVTGWLIHETGSPAPRADLEWNMVRAAMVEAASVPHHVTGTIMPSDVPGRESRVYRRPAGVVAVITPWNFPMQRSSRSVAPALAAGNAVVLKPCSDTPVAGGLLLAKIFEEAGLPPGLLSVVIGGGDLGEAIARHPVPRVLSFAGSTAVGESITRAAGVKRLALEFGGNGPLVVLDDADLGRAVDAAVFGSFFRLGQVCMIANRIIVDRKAYGEFTDRLVAAVRCLQAGDPAAEDTDIGPVINARQLGSILDRLERARSEGARQLLGGEPGGPAGLLLPPHVLLAGSDAATAREEMLGPVMTVVRARDADDALRIVNDTDDEPSTAVFTGDADRGVRFALQVRAGMTHINDSPVNDDVSTAFGGTSLGHGAGRFGSQWAIGEFTTEHWVSVQHTPRDFPV